jgi:GNAT superfamily N-acetyltransferase
LIQRIQLPAPGIEQMQAEARSEGYRFLETLVEEWLSGRNRFDAPGEMLCGHLDAGILTAVGGLNRDPFLDDPAVGRIRRVYVRRPWRNRGIGGALLDTLLSAASGNFHIVRLRAENPAAARLYERKGFLTIQSPSATHALHLDGRA